MNKHKAFVALLMAGGVAVLGLILAPAASAHTPSASLSCTDWTAVGTNYNDDPNHDQVNTVSGSIDGVVIGPVEFGSGFLLGNGPTNPLSTSAHHLLVTVSAWDDPDGSKGYSKSFDLTSEDCAPVSSEPPTSETPTTDAPTTEAPSTSTAVPSPSTSHSKPPATHSKTSHAVPPLTHAAPTPVAHTTELANTGPHTGLLIGTGIALLAAGVGVLLFANRRRGEHR